MYGPNDSARERCSQLGRSRRMLANYRYVRYDPDYNQVLTDNHLYGPSQRKCLSTQVRR